MLWATSKTNKPQTPLGFGLLRSRVVCWLLKHARAVVDEDEEAASSNRPRYEARHMPSAAMASRAARAGRRQPNNSNAAHRRSCAIRLAVRLIRGTAPKGAKMFAASDMASRCEAQSSRLVPSRTTRHLQRASRSGQISRTCSKRPPTVARSPKHGELHVAFRNDVACVEHETPELQAQLRTYEVRQSLSCNGK